MNDKRVRTKKDIYEPDPPDRHAVRCITLESYSNYVIRTYSSGSQDLDGDSRAGQEYAYKVKGDEPIKAALQRYEKNGNHKQLVSFVGDNIEGTVKLVLGDEETDEISLDSGTLTKEYLTAKLEAMTAIGEGNVKVTLYPGRWLIEFIGDLAGETFDPFEVDIPDAAVFQVHVLETKWNDAGKTIDLYYPLPLVGEWDGDDETVNDAVAAGSIATAQWFTGVGYVSDLNECRDYNGDGTPNL
ncbi:hypothetical protein [Gimesia chilikensis]|uniref:hypothetical protein n=1 Tax=Gimesia chilikensis TaxID=2605989 RepID=UPI0011887E98|nr:hypothetical protein [Gimesia chilikensis]QDT84566.1 hypothetical protein MalM14_22260 [Gimesia chilikensis]